jgi:hypothetical protein
MLPQLLPAPGPNPKPRAVKAEHPSLAMVGVDTIYFEGVELPRHIGKQIVEISFQCYEWRPPLPITPKDIASPLPQGLQPGATKPTRRHAAEPERDPRAVADGLLHRERRAVLAAHQPAAVGVWTADVELPAPADGSRSGPATLQLGSASRSSAPSRAPGSTAAAAFGARIVGGAAAWARRSRRSSYFGVPMRIPLQDILTDAGEKLSRRRTPTILAFQMPAWSRMSASPASRSLRWSRPRARAGGC